MRVFGFLVLCLFAVSLVTVAQKRKTYKINPGEKLAEVIPADEKYSYTAFTSGTTYFKNGAVNQALLNYNALFGEMQFIDLKGDTLSMADESTIKMIVIKTDTFFYDKGFLKQLKDYGAIKLARMQYFSFVNRQKIGGFGEVSSASIDSYNSISGSSYFKDLVAKELLTIARNTVYYMGDKFNNFKVLTKKNLLEFYAKREDEVQAYLKANKVDFTNEDDLTKLLSQF